MDIDRLVVAGFVLLLLGLSYIAVVAAFAARYLVPATAAYLAVATALLARLLRGGENR
jgi:uncharacterized membrane protein